MFELTKQTAVLSNLNPRIEMHGEEPQPAADLQFSFAIGNDFLAHFAPSLRSCLYHKDGNGGDLASQTHDAPNLRFPKMGAFKWTEEIIGAHVVIDHGLGGKSNIEFALADVNQFRIEPSEGGTVTVNFRVQCRPDERQAGKLYLLQGEKVEISVTPPAVEEQAALRDAPVNTAGTESERMPKDPKARKRAARQNAEKLFQ